MSDNPVSNVNRLDVQPAQQVQAQISGQVTAQAIKEKEKPVAEKPADVVKKEDQSEVPKPAQEAQLPLVSRATNLKFQVDEKPHQVTIMIMDRATNKVITTIPPDKIKDVPPGDLLQYMI